MHVALQAHISLAVTPAGKGVPERRIPSDVPSPSVVGLVGRGWARLGQVGGRRPSAGPSSLNTWEDFPFHDILGRCCPVSDIRFRGPGASSLVIWRRIRSILPPRDPQPGRPHHPRLSSSS